MGRGSPVCQQIREKIIEMFKNNVPQRKIGRDLDISPSTVHNIIKRFKESGGISVRKGQGRKPKLNNRDLRSLRRHCIKNRHSSISDITTWAQDYFGKPLSSTTIRSYIHKCQLKLYCSKRKPYVNSVQKHRRLLWAWRHLGWTITQWKRVLWSDESVFQVFFGRNGRRVLRTKEEKDHPDCYQQQVQKPGSVMVWGCVSALGKGNLHFCDGTINAEKYIEIWSTICCLQEDIFSRDVHAYFNKTMQNHILHTLQSPGCGGRGYGYLTGLPAVPTCLQ